jgi:hypothetical protein
VPDPLRDAAYARAIARAIGRLDRDTRPPAEAAPWAAFVTWAVGLRARYVPVTDAWPAAERAAAAALDATLESLREAAALEPTTTARTFRQALAAALETRRLPEGQVGQGVVVAAVGAVLGAAFDRVYIVGMAEGSFPTRPPLDPLGGGDGAPDPLRRRERQREAERRALLGALAAADGGRVVASYPRSDGAARAMHPARWLLDLAGRQLGRPVYASEMPALGAAEPEWLATVLSASDGVARAPAAAHLAERRLASVLAWRAAGRDLADHPLAARGELPLGPALRLAAARRSRAFTSFDGNLREIAGESPRLKRALHGGVLSATAVETWATCPFRYLLQNVLRVEATRRPEDEWTISPLVSGRVVHAILDQFFRELHAAGRFGPGDAFTPADHARLDAIAEEAFAQLEAEGSSGHPLAWENTRAALRADLHTLLEKDEAWRLQEQLAPAGFEQAFGRIGQADAWPAAEVRLPDGQMIRFRGLVDRIDLSPPGTVPRRALVIDYKTGSDYSYRDLQQDPLCGGRHVQLALYGRAARQALGSGEPLVVTAEYRFVSARAKFVRLPVLVDAAVDAALDTAVQTIAAGVEGGVFLAEPGEPSQGGFENCRFCDYDRVCAPTRDEAWERKRAEAGR